MVIVAILAAIGIGIGGFNYYKTHSEWYQMGYAPATSSTTRNLLYSGVSPFQFCYDMVLIASMKYSDEANTGWVMDGCIAGLKDLLGEREYQKLLRG